MIERFASLLGGLLLPELTLLRLATERCAEALEWRNAQDYPLQLQPDPGAPVVDVTYVNDAYQAEIMEIELRLLQASGAPPTEEAVLLEWERRRGLVADQ